MKDLCELDDNAQKFFEVYKNKINDIFDEIYESLNKPKIEGSKVVDLLYSKLQEKGKIEIINYDLICKLEINDIYLINEKQNLKLQILYLKKPKVKKEHKTIEYWVCNDDIAMLLCNQEKYIYYKQPKYLVRTLDEESSTISIISELSELNYVIMNDIDIYSSNTPYFKISDLKSEFDNRTKIKTMKDYLEGINSYNFETILLPDRVKFLRGNIALEEILRKNKDKFQFYIYNPKIGLTLETLNIMDSFIARSDNINQILYLNIYNILNENSKDIFIQSLAFYVSKLFVKYEEFEEFFLKLQEKITKKNYTRKRVIYKVIKYIIKNYKISNKKLYVILDNFYDYELCKEINDIIKKLEEKIKIENIFYLFFVQLNTTNLDLLKKNDKKMKFRFINNDNSIRPDEYVRTLDGDYSFKLSLINSMENDLKLKFEKKNKFEILTTLLRIKYIPLLLKSYSNYGDIEIILKEFLKYFHISCSSHNAIKITRIEFKNEIIKEFFNSKFNSTICDIVVSNEFEIFDHLINNCVEGVLLEKQIILNLIASMLFKKLKIDKIFCVSELPKKLDFNFGEKIIILQILDNSPLYDFGVITYYKNELILKIYQVGINKDNTSLKKLDKDIICFDLEYFIKKLKDEFGIDIKQYTFGIITSKNGYDYNINKIYTGEDENKINDIFYSFEDNDETEIGENLEKGYKNYKNMKKFCDKNDYEFIIFDKNTKQSFIQENDNLIPFNFFEKTEFKFIRNINQIYDKCDFSKLQKKQIKKSDYFQKDEIKSVLKEDVKIKYITKFVTNDKKVPDINVDNFYLCFKDSKENLLIRNKEGIIISKLGCIDNKINLESEKFMGCIIKKDNEEKSDAKLLNRKRGIS